jgi:hypothetical protein
MLKSQNFLLAVIGMLPAFACASVTSATAIPMATNVTAATVSAHATKASADSAMQAPQWCRRLVRRLPGVSQQMCERSQLTATGATSQRGFPLLARHIPAVTPTMVSSGATAKYKAGSQPLRVLLMGGIHGDELTSASIVFYWMHMMPSVTSSQFEWRVLPVVNPDGLLAKKAQRVNANGVDLNRNFPTPGWQQDAPRYWVKRTRNDPRRYPGPAPLSEPESRLVYDEMTHFHPDVIISVHAPYGVLDFDGPDEPPHRFGRLRLNQVGVYPGSLGNYSGVHRNVPVITIELPNAQKMPTQKEMQRIWRDMLRWIDDNVEPHQDGAIRSVSATETRHR